MEEEVNRVRLPVRWEGTCSVSRPARNGPGRDGDAGPVRPHRRGLDVDVTESFA